MSSLSNLAMPVITSPQSSLSIPTPRVYPLAAAAPAITSASAAAALAGSTASAASPASTVASLAMLSFPLSPDRTSAQFTNADSSTRWFDSLSITDRRLAFETFHSLLAGEVSRRWEMAPRLVTLFQTDAANFIPIDDEDTIPFAYYVAGRGIDYNSLAELTGDSRTLLNQLASDFNDEDDTDTNEAAFLAGLQF